MTKTEYMRRYREKHRDKIYEANARWKEKNRERVLQRGRDYYHEVVKDNPEALAKRAEYHAKWQRENADRVNAYRREWRRKRSEGNV